MKKGDIAKLVLLETTAHLIAERGSPEKVSIRDIAKRSKFAPSRVTYYFKSREILLAETAKFVESNRCGSPIRDFYEKKAALLDSKEGQAMFICALVDYFCDFFRNISQRTWNYSMLCREILRNPWSHEEKSECESNYFLKADALAFYKIYEKITGDSDLDRSHFWFTSIFIPLVLRFCAKSIPIGLDDSHKFSDSYDSKLAYFCRKQLLLGMGLWDESKKYMSIPSFRERGLAQA